MYTEKFEFLDLVDFGRVALSVRTALEKSTAHSKKSVLQLFCCCVYDFWSGGCFLTVCSCFLIVCRTWTYDVSWRYDMYEMTFLMCHQVWHIRYDICDMSWRNAQNMTYVIWQMWYVMKIWHVRHDMFDVSWRFKICAMLWSDGMCMRYDDMT